MNGDSKLGIIERVFGPKNSRKKIGPAEALASAEAALERHAAEKTAAQDELAALDRERKGLLLADGTDEAIREIAQKRADVVLRLERLAELHAPLLARLADAREAVKEATWADLASRFFPVAHDYIAAMRSARAFWEQMGALREEANRAGLGAEAKHFMVAGSLELRVEAFEIFEKMLAAAELAAKPKVNRPAVKPAKKEPPVETARIKFLKDPDPIAEGKPHQGWVGASSTMPAEKAKAYVDSGAAVYVTAPKAATPATDRDAWASQTMLLDERDGAQEGSK